MLKHRWTDRICCAVLAVTLLLTCMITGFAADERGSGRKMGYENRLFDQSRVHEIDIIIDDWEGFLESCTNEQYALCSVVIDGEIYRNVGIRAKGNTSLSSVRSFGNNRYSFKIEFDQYNAGGSYHGLDKLSLNNVIQDTTYMKDYIAYTLMNETGVAAPLCSYASISVNGEVWGLYLAVEAVEDSFLQRNYGASAGELYKPDSMSFGGGRGNGRDFNMDDFAEKFKDENGNFDPSKMFGGEMPDGMNFPDLGEMPGGMAFPGGFGMPSDEGKSDETQADAVSEATGAVPGGMNFSGFGEMHGGMAFPGGFGMPSDEGKSEEDTAGASPERSEEDAAAAQSGGQDTRRNERQRSFGGNRQFGGFGGMGSSDVKLQYTDDDPESYSNIFENAKTDVTSADRQRLIDALRRMGEGDTSAVDTDAVIRYLVVHNFLCNGDSYTGSMIHNYYLHEGNGILSMIPWDYNLSMGAFSMGGSGGADSAVNSPIDSPVSGGSIADRPMVAWIFDGGEYQRQYHERYAEFIEKIFESGWFTQKIENTIALISPYVENDPTSFYGYDEFLKGAQTLTDFCTLRAQSVSGQLNGVIPSTSEGQNANPESLIDSSRIVLSDMGGMGRGGFGMGGGFSRDKNKAASGESPESNVGENPDTGKNSVEGKNPDITENNPEKKPAAEGSMPSRPEDRNAKGRKTTPSGNAVSGTPLHSESGRMIGISAIILVLAIAIAAFSKGRSS